MSYGRGMVCGIGMIVVPMPQAGNMMTLTTLCAIVLTYWAAELAARLR